MADDIENANVEAKVLVTWGGHSGDLPGNDHHVLATRDVMHPPLLRLVALEADKLLERRCDDLSGGHVLARARPVVHLALHAVDAPHFASRTSICLQTFHSH